MKKLYAIYDIVAEEVTGPLVPVRAEAAAIRMFTELLADKKTTVGQHPSDFALIYLGLLQDMHDALPQLITAGTVITLRGSEWLAQQEKEGGA